MSYPYPNLSSWWVVYKVNPRERLHRSGDDCYRECQLEDEENYQVHQEDELPNSFNVEIAPALDSLVGVGEEDDVTVPGKRKRACRNKKVRWHPQGIRGQIDPDFDIIDK